MALTSETKPARRNFTLIFVLTLGVISVFVFVMFRGMMRDSLEQRRDVSRAHLKELFQGLQRYGADNKSAFPEELSSLHPKYVHDRDVFFHPAWPDRPGYVYITGLRPSDGRETIAIFENLPSEKERLPRLVLTLSGDVLALDKSQFEQRLTAQASLWRADKRQWLPEPVNTERLFLP